MTVAEAARPEPPEVSAVLGATFFVRFAFGITTAVFASYLAGYDTGLQPTEIGVIGLVTAMASVAEFSTVVFSGLAADHWGRWPVLGIGMVLAAATTLGFTVTRSPIALGALNFGFGVASGAILAASLAVVADDAPRHRRGHEMGRFDAVNLAGWIVGFAVGFAALGLLPNPQLLWVFPVGTGLLAVAIVFAALRLHTAPWRARSGTSPGPWKDVEVFLASSGVSAARIRRQIAVVIAPWLVIYMLIGTVLVFLASSAGSVGISPLYLAGGIAAGGLALTVTQPAFGTLADRFGTTRLMVVGTAGFVAVLAGAGWITTYGLSVLGIAVTAVGAILALGYGPAALAALAELTRATSRATTMAVYSLSISLGMTIGLFASTQLYSALGVHGLDAFFALLAAALIALVVVRGLETSAPTTRAL